MPKKPKKSPNKKTRLLYRRVNQFIHDTVLTFGVLFIFIILFMLMADDGILFEIKKLVFGLAVNA